MVLESKQYIISINICFVVFFVALSYSSINSKLSKNQLADSENQLYNLQNELSTKQSEVIAIETKVEKAVTGVDKERVANDDKLAVSFFTPAFTWSNSVEYVNARTEYIANIGADNQFVTMFMPELVVVDQYNEIDLNGINSSFKSLTSRLTDLDGDTYTYLSIIEYTSRDNSEVGNEGTGKALVSYQVVNNQISNIKAWNSID